MEFTPEELETGLVNAAADAKKFGEEWAELQGHLNSIKDRKDDFLELLKSEVVFPEGTRDTDVRRESEARLNERWTSLRDEISELSAKVLKLKVNYDVSIRRWETFRSLLSSANTQRRTCT